MTETRSSHTENDSKMIFKATTTLTNNCGLQKAATPEKGHSLSGIPTYRLNGLSKDNETNLQWSMAPLLTPTQQECLNSMNPLPQCCKVVSHTHTYTLRMFRVKRRRRWLISKSPFSHQCVGRNRDTCIAS